MGVESWLTGSSASLQLKLPDAAFLPTVSVVKLNILLSCMFSVCVLGFSFVAVVVVVDFDFYPTLPRAEAPLRTACSKPINTR